MSTLYITNDTRQMDGLGKEDNCISEHYVQAMCFMHHI